MKEAGWMESTCILVCASGAGGGKGRTEASRPVGLAQ